MKRGFGTQARAADEAKHKRSSRARAWTTLALALVGCVVLPRCGSHDEGIVLTIGLLHHYGPNEDGSTPAPYHSGEVRNFTTDLGYGVLLEQGYITLASVEIQACPSTSAAIERLVVSVAQAHTEASPTRLGEPHVESLLRADLEATDIGELNPPPGGYCLATVHFGPADDDATGLPENVEMVGLTVYLKGTFLAPGEHESQPFEIMSSGAEDAMLTLWEDATSNASLSLSAESPSGRLDIALLYDGWLDGIHLATETDEDMAAEVLANVARDVEQSF